MLLRHRDFRLFWLGQTGSLIGTWMQSVALGWLALELTDSAFMVGFVSAAGSLPVLVLALYAGVVADRRDKLRLVRLTQALLLGQAALLWWFAFSGRATIGWLTALALLGGMIAAFDIPTRQALIVELVGAEELVDAIALNSSGFNLARIIGPSIAAIIIERWGVAWCFFANAASYVLVLVGLFLIRRPAHAGGGAASPVEGLREGVRFLLGTRAVALLMALIAVYSVFGIPYLVLMPVIARDTLRSGARGYGILLAAVGVGAIAGALALAAVAQRIRRGRVLALSTYAFSLLLLAFTLSRRLSLSAALLVAVGFTMLVNNALANGLLQTMAPDHLRGRVMSAYAFVFVGLGPVGALLAGGAAALIGAPWAIAAGAAVLLAATAWVFGTQPAMRRL